MGGWDDYGYYEEEAAKDHFIEQTLHAISEDGVRSYLGQYGDAIDERVRNCIDQAEKLRDTGFFQSAVVLATTAIELIVRFLLIHPLIQAAFLSDEMGLSPHATDRVRSHGRRPQAAPKDSPTS